MTHLLLTLVLLIPPLTSGGGVAKEPDPGRQREERLACGGRIARLEPSPYGGTAIKVMLRLDGGAQAVWKPEQAHWSSRFEAEIVAYRLAKHLGVDAVPAACERGLQKSALLALASEPGQAALRARLEAELRPDAQGWVRGAAIAWVPRVSELPVTVRQDWARLLTPGAQIPHSQRVRVGDAADLLLLDLLFSNPDRFTGGNLLENKVTGRLLMIDNGAGFRPVAGLMRPYHRDDLTMLKRVRSPTYHRMKRLDRLTILALVRRPPTQGSYLTYPEVRALLKRRDALVAHVEALRRAHGDGAVLLP